nr:immunoglobulin light chain junction region [Macaca mulatta]
CRQESNWPLTF